jgi:hypothetical protein
VGHQVTTESIDPQALRRATPRMRVAIYCDVDLWAFAEARPEVGPPLTMSLSVALAMLRKRVTAIAAQLNTEPEWQSLGTWQTKPGKRI